MIKRVKNLELGGAKAVLFLIVTRILRLWPLFLTWMFVWWQLAPVIASGPFAARIAQQSGLCDSYAWTNVIFINNFYPVHFVDICFGWSWYLATDTQLFVVLGPIFLASYLWFARRGWSIWLYLGAVCAPVILACTLYRALAAVLNDAPYLSDTYMDLLYSKPYSRGPTFVIASSLAAIWPSAPK